MNIDVVPPSQNYRGMSYGEWAIEWDRWLMSEDPDRKIRKDILFLRGHLDYKPVSSGFNVPRFMNFNSFLDRTGEKGEKIFRNTAVLVPLLTARYSLGDIYDGKRIDCETQLRDAINKDTDESLRAWAVIQQLNSKKPRKIVPDINGFRIESRLYKLQIPAKSKLRNKMECTAHPGVYDSIIGGYFVIIKSLPEGRFRITFGGEGRGRYSTCSIYDISVNSERRQGIEDFSSRRLPRIQLGM